MKQATLGYTISSLRKQLGLTQVKLAEKLGVTDKAVSKWERELSFPDIALFPKLADILGVTVDDLLSKCIEDGFSSRLTKIIRMSHDIRTPLNIILGCSEMAEKHHENKERLLRYLKTIHIAGECLQDVINDMKEITSSGSVESSSCGSDKKSLCGGSGNDECRYDFSGKRILLAEDIEINREITTELLKQTGAEVEYAEDGKVCVQKVSDAPAGYYDLILMDIRMPNMDGIEATKKIRRINDSVKAGVPIIAVTANVYEEDRNAAFNAGMNEFAEKPVETKRLMAMMDRYL